MDHIEEPDQTNSKNTKKRLRVLRIIIIVLIVLAAIGLYLLKNPADTKAGPNTAITGSSLFQSPAFDLDATENFDLKAVLSYNLPVIIDFGADTCIPCKKMAPILIELNQELRGKAVVKFVDVWKNSAAGQQVPLEVIPTQFFFNADGTPYVPSDADAAAADGFIIYTGKDTGEHIYTAHQGGLDKETILMVLKEMGMK